MKSSIFLFLYATLKAFLPLPSLEVVLLPLYLNCPTSLWWYSFLGAIGTFTGGSIGYFIASRINEEKWKQYFGEDWEKGKALVDKYGILAVFIGGITPIPDFLLAYVAGFVHMHFLSFVCSDGIARFIRSVIVLYLFSSLGILVDIDKYGMYILYAFFIYAIGKYLLKGLKNKVIKHRRS